MERAAGDIAPLTAWKHTEYYLYLKYIAYVWDYMICVSVHICICTYIYIWINYYAWLYLNCHPIRTPATPHLPGTLLILEGFCGSAETKERQLLPNRYKRHPRALPKTVTYTLYLNCLWVGDIPPYLFSTPARWRNSSPKMARIYEASTKQKARSKYPTCNLNMDDFQSKSSFFTGLCC